MRQGDGFLKKKQVKAMPQAENFLVDDTSHAMLGQAEE